MHLCVATNRQCRHFAAVASPPDKESMRHVTGSSAWSWTSIMLSPSIVRAKSWIIYSIHEILTSVIWRLGEVTDDVLDDVDDHWTASGIVLIHMMNQPERSGQCQEQAE
jgi:hypothetical protein